VREHRRGLPPEDPKKKPMTAERVRALLPDVWALLKPRRGILVAGLFVMAINRASGLVLPASSKFLIDDVIGAQNLEKLVPLVAIVLAATLIQGATTFALTQLLSKAAQRLIAELRQKVQRHIGRLPVTYYDSNKTGALVSRIMTDVEGIRNLLGTGLVDLAGGLITSAIALVVLLRISPQLTLFCFTALVLFGLFLWRALKTIRPIFRERGRINAEVAGRLTESLGAVRVVKGYRAEEREAAVFSAGVHRLLANVLRSLTGIAVLSLSGTTLMGTVGAVVMLIGGRQVLSGAISLGEFVTFSAFLSFLVAPAFQIIGVGTTITEALAGLERTREVLRERPEDEDPRRQVDLPELTGDVVFEGVGFAYDGGQEVLHEINLHAPPGTVTALVGPSGSGKSTMIGLIAGFYTPLTGRVLVDGVDLSTARLSSYRSHLGVVLQDSFLFDGSIRENVAFSRPEASDDQIERACRLARVDEFAARFENGYETVVGERGVKLSGGQKQRVAIARALLADPRILILDEATSSLDSESEAEIQEGLASLMKNRTTFVIAHRLSTIRQADQILVTDGGRIVERGTHTELLAAKGRYFELYTRQHGVEAGRIGGGPLERGETDGAIEEGRLEADLAEERRIAEERIGEDPTSRRSVAGGALGLLGGRRD